MAIFVIGNAAVDETFAVASLPRGGESIFGRPVSRDLGGKGANQAVVLARAGVEVRFVAAVGDDERGRWIGAALAEEALATVTLVRQACPSDLSLIFTRDGGENAIVTTTDAAEGLAVRDVEVALADTSPGDWLVLQGNLSVDATRFALEAARSGGMISCFNPSPVQPDFSGFWSLVDLAVVNESEAAALTGVRAAADAAAAIQRAGTESVVVTLGAKGALVRSRSGSFAVPAARAAPVDTTGAGDAFTGTLIASAALRGLPAPDRTAVEAATRVAALTVSRNGTRRAFPTRQEMAALLA